MVAALVAGASCEISVPGTVDPGPNFTVPMITFNSNYFYCVVEPQIILGGLTGTPCGDNGSHGCHYSDKVPGMVLEQHPPVACSGSGVGAIPTDMTAIAAGMPAALNLNSVSQQMSAQYMNANIYIWPTSAPPMHPVMVYSSTDTKVVSILMTWATLP
jgi:hypothetical protein